MLGAGSVFAAQAYEEGWVGTGWLQELDLSSKLYEAKSDFTSEITPILLGSEGTQNKFAAGAAASATWVVAKQM